MNAWTKTHRRVVDQRSEILPPAWCPRAPSGANVPVRTSGVTRSDPSRETARAVVSAIDRGEVIVAMTFLLADAEIEDALLRAAKRGARVYLMLATEARLDKEPREDSEFDQEALAHHKAMLKRLAGWVLLRSAGAYHAKIVLVDPAKGGPGFLLTSNLTKEALTQSEELAVELTPAEREAVFRHLAWAMWEGAERELLAEQEPQQGGRLLPVVGPLGRFARPGESGTVVCTPMQAGTLRAALLARIRAARSSITVASFGWGLDHEAMKALEERARSGVRVTALARVRASVTPALVGLARSGARVLGFPRLHAKALLVDGRDAMVMTANLETRGLDESFEMGVILDGARAAGVAAILGAWAENAPHELRAAPLLGEVLGEAHVLIEKRLVPYRVIASDRRAPAPLVAESADRLDAEPTFSREKTGLPIPAHQIEATWDVAAPRLAPGSKEVASKDERGPKPGDPRVFREPSGRVVVAVRTTDEIPRAQALAAEVKAAAIVVSEK